ncbi:hypothetical protein MHAE_07719 [Mycobacterium haemophilum DSM 44634]|uniref:nucleoside 2-deoxyribosyltransferase n=1 Tax=Mycobacterium haemophilum TaxID=29311 RepID=UPI0006D434EC|nr:nucleoside 2-deoxyribosyltransferase [Mycobacterium haemophilum]ALL56246.1 hypothetical protein B586_19995 [Mycobacterium haemophilum DSM 44634]MCV7340847.1 nucleoside 2-deoxyribosyltransferase [Mycobacterium haemophilum DSM 44634]
MRVFVAAPFGSYLDADGVFDPHFRRQLEEFYDCLSGAGFEYFSAQVNENWGSTPLLPRDCVPIDYKELASSDVVVAVLGRPPSLGVAVELGWASALQKPILILGTSIAASSMIAGLDRVADVRFIDKDLGHGPDATGLALGRLVCDHLSTLSGTTVNGDAW